jgi:hypothetical protein
MNMNVSIPEELYRRATAIAAEEKVSVDELFASAFEERLVELERLKARAERGRYERFLRAMSKVPAAKPADYDSL